MSLVMTVLPCLNLFLTTSLCSVWYNKCILILIYLSSRFLKEVSIIHRCCLINSDPAFMIFFGLSQPFPQVCLEWMRQRLEREQSVFKVSYAELSPFPCVNPKALGNRAADAVQDKIVQWRWGLHLERLSNTITAQKIFRS